MFEKITPGEAGVDSRYVERFIKDILRHSCNMHSVLMMKGDKLFS